MKPMSLNLSKMKKIAQDKNSSTFVHPSGHKMVIAHSGVSTLQRKQLESMPVSQEAVQDQSQARPINQESMVRAANDLYGNPHSSVGQFADGGEAMPEQSEAEPDRAPAAEQSIAVNFKNPQIPESLATQGAAPQPEQAPAPARAQRQGSDPFGVKAYSGQMNRAMELESEGTQEANRIRAQQLAAQAEHESSYQKRQDEIMTNYSNNMAHLQDEDQKTKNEIATQAIKPNHFIDSMSTGAKIRSGIGMILGGMGAAKTGQPNLAYDYLQRQIANDIEAQKANLSEGNNLLAHNLSLMGNLNDATKMTELQLGDLVHSQIAQDADNAGTPMALAQNQIVQAQFAQKKAELQKQLAMSQALLNSNSGSEESFQNRNTYLRMTGQGDMAKHLEDHHVPGSGASSVPVTQETRQALVHYKNLEDLFNRADKYLTDVGTLGAGWQNANAAEGRALEQGINLQLGGLEKLNRYTHEEGQKYQTMVPDLAGTHFTGQDRAKLDSLRTELMQKASNEYKGVGIRSPMSPSQPEIKTIVKDGKNKGRIAIFDHNKKFLRWGN